MKAADQERYEDYSSGIGPGMQTIQKPAAASGEEKREDCSPG